MRRTWAILTTLLVVSVAATTIASYADPVTVKVGGIDRTLYLHSYALLIGESEYKTWLTLPKVVDDIKGIKDGLIAQGFEDHNILVELNVTSDKLERLIGNFIASHGDAKSRLLIYYAGHGATNTNTHVGYLVPVDAPKQSADDFATHAVALPVIKTILSLSTALHTLVIFDSCFSGTVFLTRGNIHPEPFSATKLDSYTRPRVQIITSGDEDQQVPADSEFSNVLIAALNGAVSEGNSPIITADQLGVWLANHVQETTVRIGSAGRESAGEFMFAIGPPGDAPRGENEMIGSIRLSGNSRLSRPYSGFIFTTSNIASINPPVSNLSVYDVTRYARRGDITVLYYKKSADGLNVLRALDKSGFTYVAQPPEIGDIFGVNTLACSQKSDFLKVKWLAVWLIQHDVPLRMITTIKHRYEGKNVVEILTYLARPNTPLTSPLLTVDDVNKLTKCPEYFGKGCLNTRDLRGLFLNGAAVMLTRRKILVAAGLAMPSLALADIPDWRLVVETQRGDPELLLETITLDAESVQRLMHSRAEYKARLSDLPNKVVTMALNNMVGWSREATPEKIASILDVYNLPFRDQNGRFTPFCAAGISYATAVTYLTALGMTNTLANLRNILQEIEHYHFYPSPSVWDIYFVARGKRRWIDGQPNKVIPRPGWLVVYDWQKKGGADHVGMVIDATGSKLTTLEFNTSGDNNTNGGRVAVRHRPYNGQVKGFDRTDLDTPF